MPYFTLHRNFTLRTTKGRSFAFEKGKEIWVTPECVEDAVAIGAVPKDAIDVIPPEKAPPKALTPSERETALFACFDELVAKGERMSFGANGLPVLDVVKKAVGFDVTNRERDAAWMKYRAAKAED